MNVTLLHGIGDQRNAIKWPFFEGLHRSASNAGITATLTHKLHGPADYVIGWGWGAWWRHPLVNRFAMMDLGYFGRGATKRQTPIRLAFGKMHNPEMVAEEWVPKRWQAHGIPLRDDYDPDGHIVLAGQGRKSCVMYGEKPGEWERRKLAEIRAAYESHRKVVFRAKPGRGHLDRLGKLPTPDGPIHTVLEGAALVVCRHSNVAIDALIAGVPVVCEDGLAAAVCPSEVRPGIQPPSVEDRLRVLRCAAWLNWTREEAANGAMWAWLKTRIA